MGAGVDEARWQYSGVVDADVISRDWGGADVGQDAGEGAEDELENVSFFSVLCL